jgi:hypothetical protein
MLILIENHKKEIFLTKLKDYYENNRKEEYLKLSEDDKKITFFSTRSGKGACILYF